MIAHKEGMNILPATRKSLEVLLRDFVDIFSPKLDETTVAKRTPIHIETTGPVPNQPRFNVGNPKLRGEMMAQLEDMRLAGLWRFLREDEKVDGVMNIFPIVQNGKVRMLLQCQPLNKVARKNPYPMQPPLEVLNHARRATIFSTVDDTKAFFQHPLDEESMLKVPFYVPEKGIGVWCRLPMGYTNAPAELHAYKDAMLRNFASADLSYSFDDTIMYSGDGQKSREEVESQHLEVIRRYFEACRKFGNFLSIDKCHLFFDQVKHQGFIVGHGTWAKDPAAVQPLLDMDFPRNRKEMQELIGCFGFYDRFIEGYATVAAPLFEMLKDDGWPKDGPSVRQIDALETVKRLLAQKTMLTMPDWDKEMVVRVDASPTEGVGAVLGQIHDGVFCPIAFGSRRSTAAEKKFWSTEMELHAVVWAVTKKFRAWTYGSTVIVVNDGKSVRDLMNHRNLMQDQINNRILSDVVKLADSTSLSCGSRARTCETWTIWEE